MIERKYREPEEHPEVKGWFKHPELSIWLSKEDDRVLTENGFVEPSVGGEYKYFIRRHIHVLKLETFLEKPTNQIKFMGNHRDGDKFNNQLDNLEWTTCSGNLIHAYENGLRSDISRGLLVDLSDGVVRSFSSQRECAQWLDIPPSVLTGYLKGNRTTPIKYKYAIKLSGEGEITLTKEDIGKFLTAQGDPFIVQHRETGEKKHFVKWQSAAKFFGKDPRTVKRLLEMGGDEIWAYRKIESYEEYLDCLEKDERYQSMKSKLWLRSQGRDKREASGKIRVTDHLKNIVSEFENVYVFAEVNQYMVSEINRALKTKNSWREFTFEFLG